MNTRLIPAVFLVILLLISCGQDYPPKPRGFFRIDLPEKAYQIFDTAFPYEFEYPLYASIRTKGLKQQEPFWLDLQFTELNATMHLSYKKVNGNLVDYLEDARTLVIKHMPKANAIRDSLIIRPEHEVFGLFYEIIGAEAASPLQFFVTDSSRHFVRAALYFNTSPNNDSLAPVIDFLKKDMKHMIQTFNWKNEIEP